MANVNLKARSNVTERFVTIQQLYRSHNSKWYKQVHGNMERPPVRKTSPFCPWIRLAGRWLERAGFEAGQRVKINVEHGRLTITAE